MVALIGLTGMGSSRAASLDPSVLPRIQQATFEVVAAKPVNDPLSYEKPLPLELLPFQQRNDKYYSIGTAFALGNNRYVTAAHVLQVGIGSLWGEPALRDAEGQVFAIDKIEKYSLQQDFVVFSLARQPAQAAALEVNRTPTLNGTVYAVGNALGTGVVIRDGLYTSDTPEEENGRWKWMRFSAAASPGNSGGPLLDQDGKVIGIVLMKSANENLNYALPIGMILDAPDHLASLDKRIPYQFDVFDTVLSNTLKTEFALPLSFAKFSAAFQQRFNDYADGQLKALLVKDPQKMFPNSAGSRDLLYGIPSMSSFPALITRNSNGDWDLSSKYQTRVKLDDNGYVDVGNTGRNLLFHVRRPDSLSASQLYDDPQKLMDLIATVGFMKRQVGPESIKITSLGKPASDSTYTDAWQRHWRVQTWPVPNEDIVVMTFSLPVPDGYVTLMRITPPSQQHDYLINLQALTDFFYVTYDGTLAQWKDYLAHARLLPEALKHIKLDIDYGKRFSYASKRVSFAVTPDLQTIDKDSALTLWFSYFKDQGKVVWDVAGVDLEANTHDDNAIKILRNPDPADYPDDSYRNEWNKLVQHQHPYDAVARSDNDVMKITAVVKQADDPKPLTLYTAYYDREGNQPQDEMKTKLDLLLKTLQVNER